MVDIFNPGSDWQTVQNSIPLALNKARLRALQRVSPDEFAANQAKVDAGTWGALGEGMRGQNMAGVGALGETAVQGLKNAGDESVQALRNAGALDTTGLTEAGAGAREQMSQRGQNFRTGLTEQGQNFRTGVTSTAQAAGQNKAFEQAILMAKLQGNDKLVQLLTALQGLKQMNGQ